MLAELSVFCGSVVGSCLGFFGTMLLQQKFLWATLVLFSEVLYAIAIIVKHEIVLAIIGGLFVLETVSVIIQVVSFKPTGKEFLKWLQYITILKKRVGRSPQ